MPRHPPYTLSSLTTFIDHRHTGRGETYKKSITDRSPKRCSTTLTRRKDHRGDHGDAGVSIAEGLQLTSMTITTEKKPVLPSCQSTKTCHFEPHLFTCQRANRTHSKDTHDSRRRALVRFRPRQVRASLLPGAYRRLPRLSSPLDAKTSTMHP